MSASGRRDASNRKRSSNVPQPQVVVLDDDSDAPPPRLRRLTASNDETVLRSTGNVRGGRSRGGSNTRGAASSARGRTTGNSSQNQENQARGNGRKPRKTLTELQRQTRNRKARERQAKQKAAEKPPLTIIWNLPPIPAGGAPAPAPRPVPNPQADPRPVHQLVPWRPKPTSKQQDIRTLLAQLAAARAPSQQRHARPTSIPGPRSPRSQKVVGHQPPPPSPQQLPRKVQPPQPQPQHISRQPQPPQPPQLVRQPLVQQRIRQPAIQAPIPQQQAQGFVFRVPMPPGPGLCGCGNHHHGPRRMIIGGNTPGRSQKPPTAKAKKPNPEPVPGPSNAVKPPPSPAPVAGPSNNIPIPHVHDLTLNKLPGIRNKLDAVKRVLADVENVWQVFGTERQDIWDQIDKTWKEVTQDFLHRSDMIPPHLISLLTQSPAYKTRNHTSYVTSRLEEMQYFFSQIEKALADEEQVIETGDRYHTCKALTYAPLKNRPDLRNRKRRF